ncbi:GerAB/ArcD/ProY family transporter [Alkalihalobacterium elongatum]|uniref:GerAB/ArcD/ProY family transporter n=1 Tax=Alkalihalobacterium elongatum TaxID=2675466 RepID=UPI001C1F71CB|nr:GerAB/ArcD/ProY family transporter [Alkalihalobacterium elongatum]
MNNSYYRITPIEMSIVLISAVLSSSIITAPRTLASEIGTPDGWISILLNGIFMVLTVSLYVKLQRNFPGETLLQFFEKGRAGKWFAKFIGLILALYFILNVALVVRVMVFSVKMYLLDQTPSEVLVAIFLLTSSYAVSKGVQGIVHINLMFLPIILFVIVMICLSNFNEIEFGKILPIMSEGVLPIIKGSLALSLPFIGDIPILFYLMSFMGGNLSLKPLNIAGVIVTLMFLLIVVVTNSIFSIESIQKITFPFMEIAKVIEVPGEFFERLESVTSVIWIMALFTSTSIYQLLAIKIIKDVVSPKGGGSWISPIIVFISMIVAFLPQNITELESLGSPITYLGLGITYSSIVLGYLAVWKRKQR